MTTVTYSRPIEKIRVGYNHSVFTGDASNPKRKELTISKIENDGRTITYRESGIHIIRPASVN